MLDKAVGQARRAGYEAALRDAGLMPRAQRISVAKFNMESGYEQARQLFERAGEINALFCATDTIAIGAIQYCRSQGLRVPKDVMVASVGDSRAGRVAYVPLTSAHLHYRTAGGQGRPPAAGPAGRSPCPPAGAGTGLGAEMPRFHR